MKRNQTVIILILITAALSSTSCDLASSSVTPISNSTILTLIGSSGPAFLSMEELKALPTTEGMGGIISSTGQITIPELYKGVSLKDMITALGNTFDSSMGVTLTAEDGYSMTYSYDQVFNGDFIAYDPALGTELSDHDPLTAILAYERNGQPLDPAQDGYLRVVIVSEKNNQVTDGHWSIKWVNMVEVHNIGKTWELELEGAIMSLVGRGPYQSCASPSCHGVEWQDDNGQTWVGVPLWLLVGEVDDEDSHSEFAFDDELASSGYTIDVVGSDGYTVTLESVSIARNGNMILAYLVNNSDLPEKYYPLRLVGNDFESNQMVGQVAKIVVHFP